MSSPFVYFPQSSQQTPYIDLYYPQSQSSPFFPPAGLFPHSPFPSPRTLPLPPSPSISQPNTPRRVHFEDDLPLPDLPPRPRRPSWHGATASPRFAAQAGLGFSFSQPSPSSSFYSPRRRSFGNAPLPSWFNTPTPSSPWPYPSQPTQFRMHPLLNGEAPRPDFFFDLSSPKFSPLRLIAPGHSIHVDMDDLVEVATHPPITHLRIICDALPLWPIEIQQTPYETATTLSPIPFPTALPPITLGDILVAIHRGLHRQISHLDWARLSVSEETAVARAYTRRCKSVPGLAQLEASQGVKRVDFLLDMFIFRGLVRVPSDDGWETWKLMVG